MVDLAEAGDALGLRAEPNAHPGSHRAGRPVVLAVDDNPHLLVWFERVLADAGVTPLIAATAQEARDIAARQRLDLPGEYRSPDVRRRRLVAGVRAASVAAGELLRL